MENIYKINDTNAALKDRVCYDLVKIFKQIQKYNNEDPDKEYINLDNLRESVSSSYSYSFPLNEPGDAASFLNMLNDTLSKIFDCRQESIDSLHVEIDSNATNNTLSKDDFIIDIKQKDSQDRRSYSSYFDENRKDSTVTVGNNPINRNFMCYYLSSLYYSSTGRSDSASHHLNMSSKFDKVIEVIERLEYGK